MFFLHYDKYQQIYKNKTESKKISTRINFHETKISQMLKISQK